jgi:hypothetical protein
MPKKTSRRNHRIEAAMRSVRAMTPYDQALVTRMIKSIAEAPPLAPARRGTRTVAR